MSSGHVQRFSTIPFLPTGADQPVCPVGPPRPRRRAKTATNYLESNLILGILSQRQWIGALGSPGLQINSGLLPRGGVWESAGASVALLQPGTDLVAIRDYLVRAATTSRDGDKPEDEVRRPSNLVSMPVSSLTRPSH